MAEEYLKNVMISRPKNKLSRADLFELEPTCLRAFLRERTHHTIEVELYPILLGRKQAPAVFGMEPELMWEVMEERGLLDGGADLVWCKRYIDIAKAVRAGEKVELGEPLPEPFSPEEMRVVKKLIEERKSVRDWVKGKKVPKELIEQILEAGRAAPLGCNLGVARFIVIDDPEEAKMCWSDIPTPMDSCTLIVICYDARVYQTTGAVDYVAHNQGYDCAAAGDHMLLMAHALGLGGVWLTCMEKTKKRFQELYGLPEYIVPAMHIAVGYTAIGSIKSLRLPLKDMIITRDTFKNKAKA